jgi:hypothetical protein
MQLRFITLQNRRKVKEKALVHFFIGRGIMHSHLVEREGPTGKINRVFLFDRDGVLEREHDIHGRILRRFVYDRDTNSILEYTGEKDEQLTRTLSFEESHATLSVGGKYGKISRTFQIHPDHSRIKEREGGKYGIVKRTFLFDSRGILEKEGEEFRDIRMFIFEPIGNSITERAGGWFGKTNRVFIGERMSPDTFRDPLGFLQLLFLIDA